MSRVIVGQLQGSSGCLLSRRSRLFLPRVSHRCPQAYTPHPNSPPWFSLCVSPCPAPLASSSFFLFFLPWATSPPHFACHQFIFTPSSYHPSRVGTCVSGPIQPFAGSPRGPSGHYPPHRSLQHRWAIAAGEDAGRDRGKEEWRDSQADEGGEVEGEEGGARWNEVSDKLSKGG